MPRGNVKTIDKASVLQLIQQCKRAAEMLEVRWEEATKACQSDSIETDGFDSAERGINQVFLFVNKLSRIADRGWSVAPPAIKKRLEDQRISKERSRNVDDGPKRLGMDDERNPVEIENPIARTRTSKQSRKKTGTDK